MSVFLAATGGPAYLLVRQWCLLTAVLCGDCSGCTSLVSGIARPLLSVPWPLLRGPAWWFVLLVVCMCFKLRVCGADF